MAFLFLSLPSSPGEWVIGAVIEVYFSIKCESIYFYSLKCLVEQQRLHSWRDARC